MSARTYLDHNATTPLRAEARQAMSEAMDLPGNPASVHAEGRAAKALMERARSQVADLVGCAPNQVIFTGSATEAAALAVAQKHRHGGFFAALPTEHDCLAVWSDAALASLYDRNGALSASGASAFTTFITQRADAAWQPDRGPVALVAMSAANSETGVMPAAAKVVADNSVNAARAGTVPYSVICDITQMAGKMPVVYDGDRRPSYMILSAHKMGGPKGVGALINFTSEDPQAIIRGGGQEMGRRSGTENITGIAGFGAAAEAAARDVAAGRWDEVAELRKILENALAAGAKTTIFVGKEATRLPNTICFATPGWKGEAQVIQMDLAGFAISAGSACSSGKVRASAVLRAMGFDDETSASAIRVSLGLETTKKDVLRFAEAWLKREEKFRARAA
ncbi:aminotransferase class V-fold PLP-dependent enzyme [Roseobacter ponti]|uniref:Cysteine desulfurase n=1 Tax=Roseobacter ponti TaxID=1891787 RepID=A0A858SQW7_9RHOB|nr:aminotransferase class V-fold PLP-dependent enzyme [Roseobacter ponti]QJF51259.1 aminotransferase class V-fold PLP-dependent enzyme [Roseobacter ponti]